MNAGLGSRTLCNRPASGHNDGSLRNYHPAICVRTYPASVNGIVKSC